mmetsp:Transcript_36895/g.88844  ORF Transcript_36895/g.88844 Transcript_36895/m.88844 type:complete len:345 (+) Transcript_36895:26-1060(+)
MATVQCFHHHIETAKGHEKQARVHEAHACKFEGVSSSPPPPGVRDAAAVQQRAQNMAMNARKRQLQELKLAEIEYKNAVRLRPRDPAARDALRRCSQDVSSAASAIAGPTPIPLLRVVARYNLALRYWDQGKERCAIDEARAAVRGLEEHGLPAGCARHCLEEMLALQAYHYHQDREVRERLKRHPRSVRCNYGFALTCFDKRQLIKAEEAFVQCKAILGSLGTLALARRKPATPGRHRGVAQEAVAQLAEEADNEKYDRIREDLTGLGDDLQYVRELRELYCEELEDNKADVLKGTGVRDGLRPDLLPCLRSRFPQHAPTGICPYFAEWLRNLDATPGVDWQV